MTFDPSYQAPEALEAFGSQDDQKFESDFWAIGVILFELLSGARPFASENEIELISQIKEGNFQMKTEIWNKVSNLAKELIYNLLETN